MLTEKFCGRPLQLKKKKTVKAKLYVVLRNTGTLETCIMKLGVQPNCNKSLMYTNSIDQSANQHAFIGLLDSVPGIFLGVLKI